ncbi:NAD(P)/FAD-dependent oxidoreductase [Sulfobacillus sp. hq2]|uniref:NAD(P)/FAD-dependent oxidoreductase n=1 Tax=Sulfobacillus sp. hq2 TaxID=2039167 RepID=UPI000CD1DB88|nr:FAD-dependent oxidoreductase [Sulfobacillus sp. hq2]POB09126.1 FAD-dependent oxidoreductase [Sulfobacillus sp. hq2]
MQKIVVVGGGYAGLGALGALRDLPETELILVEPGEGHQLIPELPEALAKHDTVDHHVMPYSELLKEVAVSRLPYFAVGLDTHNKTVLLQDHDPVQYDWLVLAPGSEPSLPPIPGLREVAHTLRDGHDARGIKDALRYAKDQRVAVIGGGLTGVEVAGMLAIDHDVILVEGFSRLLPALGIGLSTYAYKRLIAAGVTVVMGQKLVRVTDTHIELEKDHYGYDILIWAGGITPPAWIRQSGLPVDSRGYPVADGYGEVLPQVFVAGDLWHVVVDGEDIPATAQLAALAGNFVGQTIASRLTKGQPGPEFRPHLRGMLISLDEGQGVGWVLHGGIPVRGFSARTLKNYSFQQYRLKLSKIFDRPWP